MRTLHIIRTSQPLLLSFHLSQTLQLLSTQQKLQLQLRILKLQPWVLAAAAPNFATSALILAVYCTVKNRAASALFLQLQPRFLQLLANTLEARRVTSLACVGGLHSLNNFTKIASVTLQTCFIKPFLWARLLLLLSHLLLLQLAPGARVLRSRSAGLMNSSSRSPPSFLRYPPPEPPPTQTVLRHNRWGRWRGGGGTR